MNAGDVFSLEIYGRTTVKDGRTIVVYGDGRFVHAVLAQHWDDCGFDRTDDGERTNDNFDAWNRARDQWPDDMTAIEAAWRLNIDCIHSAHSGSCRRMQSDDVGACREIASAHAGEHYTSEAFLADSDRVLWDGVWPVIDSDGDLTGEITDGDAMLNVNEDAMISPDDARDGGWVIDSDEGRATPPATAAQ